MKLQEDSTNYFVQDPEYVIEYLKSRGVDNEAFEKFLQGFTFGLLEDVCFSVDDEPFEITHLLGKSKIQGYDIVSANRNLGLSDGDNVAIALVVGDDVVCYNTVEKNVCICFIQNGEGEEVEINDSLEAFIKHFE